MSDPQGMHRRGFMGAVSAGAAMTATDLAVAGVSPVGTADLTLQHFRSRVGETFRLLSDIGRFDVTLTEAVEVGSGRDRAAEFRAPFSVLFRGRMPVPNQGMFVLKHPTLGSCSLFLAPVDRSDNLVTLEAVFG